MAHTMLIRLISHGCLTALFMLLNLSTSPSHAAPPHTVSAQSQDYCPSYCHPRNGYEPGELCYSPLFCCGDDNYRYCCNSTEDKLPDNVRDVTWCYTWVTIDWGYALALLGAIVAITAAALCACRCRDKHFRRSQSTAANGHPTPATSMELDAVCGGSSTSPPPSVFNPHQPYAFEPPEYKKDPPTYREVDDAHPRVEGGGADNLAYTHDHPHQEDATGIDAQHLPPLDVEPPGMDVGTYATSPPPAHDAISMRSLPPPYRADDDSVHHDVIPDRSDAGSGTRGNNEGEEMSAGNQRQRQRKEDDAENKNGSSDNSSRASTIPTSTSGPSADDNSDDTQTNTDGPHQVI